jgi:hypothetical protein
MCQRRIDCEGAHRSAGAGERAQVVGENARTDALATAPARARAGTQRATRDRSTGVDMTIGRPTHARELHREGFRRSFPDMVPRILAEWPDVERDALDSTDGDLDATVSLIAHATQHSKTLVRRHLAELADVEARTPSPMEARLARVLEALEAAVGPLEAEAERVANKVARVVEGAEAEGRVLAHDVRRSVDATERTLRGNFWTTLLVTLGLGVLAGLFVGGRHGRR